MVGSAKPSAKRRNSIMLPQLRLDTALPGPDQEDGKEG